MARGWGYGRVALWGVAVFVWSPQTTGGQRARQMNQADMGKRYTLQVLCVLRHTGVEHRWSSSNVHA